MAAGAVPVVVGVPVVRVMVVLDAEQMKHSAIMVSSVMQLVLVAPVPVSALHTDVSPLSETRASWMDRAGCAQVVLGPSVVPPLTHVPRPEQLVRASQYVWNTAE